MLLIDDPSLNAFAAPGSVIGVNGGLFLEAENEGQFASVMAHEGTSTNNCLRLICN